MNLGEPQEDLKNRLPVWVACSRFYLDTAMDESDYIYIARECAESPYSPKQLDKIMFCEMWPAFARNLMSMAGDWAGWEDKFIEDEVLRTYRARTYIWWWLDPFKLLYCRKWFYVLTLVKRLRAAS